MSINKEHDERTRRDRIVGMLICGIILLWTLAFCGTHANAAPPDTTFTLSTEASESPASTTITWDCKGAAATALSDPSQKAWSGAVALTGTRKMTNIRIPSIYGIRCDSAPGPSGFTIKWDMPQMVNADGSPLTDLLAWEVTYGTLPDQRPTHVRIPTPTARDTFIQVPAGDYFVSVQGVVSRTLQGKATEMLGHESNVVQKTSTASQVESTTITKQIDVYTLPAAPVAQ